MGLFHPMIERIMQKQVHQQRTNYATNNIAKSHVKWGLRIDRRCLRPGFHGHPDTYVSLFLDIDVGFSSYKERKQ